MSNRELWEIWPRLLTGVFILVVGISYFTGFLGGTPPTNAAIIKALDGSNGGLANVPNTLRCSEVRHGKTNAGQPYWDMTCKGFGNPRDSQAIRAVRHDDGRFEAYAIATP